MSFTFHPVLRYEHAPEAIDWLERAFGFEKHAVFPGPNNTVMHAELRFGTGTVGLSSAGPVDPANVWTTVREGIYICIDDPDARHDRAKAEGAVIERALEDQDYGSRDFTARDHEGHLWAFGTYSMSDAPGVPIFYPGLRYENGRRAVEFLTRAFGLEAGLQVRDDAGDVHHGELWLENGVLMIGSGPDPKGCWAGRRQCTYVSVDDAVAHHASAARAGAYIVRAPEDTTYGSRGYLVQDLEGFLWSFSTYRPERT